MILKEDARTLMQMMLIIQEAEDKDDDGHPTKLPVNLDDIRVGTEPVDGA